ncbi:hypothetical protein BO78DRAFT_225352 [Aspergillus sclerotiicarbonarius CBS 121057]|uniref:Uncharacterized protein n=1 Tax=Aspergillus sclerotiicarbonarius (strain CBS 121057 / IBT 28362) TaxID=1448318 RepID=A0A319EEL9_ASPSB|nr:hypothetical protein BO78DRAFT_225352 [Aspergillus sclerotiicarbonarius CBS 121057]
MEDGGGKGMHAAMAGSCGLARADRHRLAWMTGPHLTWASFPHACHFLPRNFVNVSFPPFPFSFPTAPPPLLSSWLSFAWIYYIYNCHCPPTIPFPPLFPSLTLSSPLPSVPLAVLLPPPPPPHSLGLDHAIRGSPAF